MLAVMISSEVFPQHSGPVSQFTCIGDTAMFEVEHSFDFVTFNWEESTDNISFSSLTGINGYSGSETAELTAYTSVLNPSGSGIYRFYRCRMYSNIYNEWSYSDTAFLEINIPPTVNFSWTNPCQGQTVHFESSTGAGAGPFKYFWDFGDGGDSISLYLNPSHVYADKGIFDVTLTVTDANGCKSSVTKPVKIYSIPDFEISGKAVICSNELGVTYSAGYLGELDGDTVLYQWDIGGFGTIENNTGQEISINWNAVTEPTQTKILLTATIEPSGCSTQISSDVLITSYVAPPPAVEVYRKPNASSLLIYRGPEVNSFQWGFTDDKGDETEIEAEKGGNRFYCDFKELKSNYEYWIETSYDSRINCVTRSYLKPPYKITPGQSENDPAFTIYPVPASDHMTIRFDNIESPSALTIYNLMMQKVYSNTNLIDARYEYTMGLEHFISGIYIIQVTDDSGLNNFRVFTIEK